MAKDAGSVLGGQGAGIDQERIFCEAVLISRDWHAVLLSGSSCNDSLLMMFIIILYASWQQPSLKLLIAIIYEKNEAVYRYSSGRCDAGMLGGYLCVECLCP